MAKRKRKKHIISEKEFIFNFLSLIIIIIIALYFGGRSFYYYSKQNMTIKADSKTLNGLIVSKNKITKTGDGLYRDTEGYYFKGDVNNNYVLFGNNYYRVIRINNDNTVKLVTNDLVSSFIWGDDSKYEFSNLKIWLNKSDKYTGVFYNTLPNPNKFLTKTSYQENILEDGSIKEAKNVYKDFVTTLSISDYILAGGKKSYLNNKKIFYLLGLTNNNENLYVDVDGSVNSCDSLDGYGIRAVITLKEGLVVSSGDGSQERPFIVSQGQDINYVNSYVKLKEDLYQVFEESNEGILKMFKNGYIYDNNNSEISLNYSKSTSHFNILDNSNIGNYLNTTYLSNLTYANLLVDNYYFTGEVSSENNYKYTNIYNNSVICKVGLLNIFDYNPNSKLNDYFYLNTTSNIGGIQYSRLSNGMLEEVDVKESKHIVPVISINKNIIKGGKGLVLEPYVVE